MQSLLLFLCIAIMPDGLNHELLLNLLYVMAHERELHFSTASKLLDPDPDLWLILWQIVEAKKLGPQKVSQASITN